MFRTLVVSVILAPWLLVHVQAGMFPKDSMVKMLDPKAWKKAAKKQETAMVAFVAPWCGHCQRMSPEYAKAALGLHPFIPTYAVNCDEERNKRLCAEQDVKGFPTVKIFPKGLKSAPILYEGERTSSGFFYFAQRRIPNHNKKLYQVEEVKPYVDKPTDKPRAFLLNKDKKVPLLWTSLANKYDGKINFASHFDRKGKASEVLGYEAGEKKGKSKLLIFAPDSTAPYRYEGIMKLDSLTKFFDSVLDGSADLPSSLKEAKDEDYTPTEEELEIERQQEAQKIALAHGGFADFIDFEEEVKKRGKDGVKDYHSQHGFGGGAEEMAKAHKARKEEAEKVVSAAAGAGGVEETNVGEVPPIQPPVVEKSVVEKEKVEVGVEEPITPVPPPTKEERGEEGVKDEL